MSDVFHFDEPMNQSQAFGYVISAADGAIELSIASGHTGNGQDKPWAGVEIIVNDVQVLYRDTVWQDGEFLFKATVPLAVKSGATYKICGQSKNKNASATSIKLGAKRLI